MFYIVPIVMRANIFIVNIDKNFLIEEYKSKGNGVELRMNDYLNFHSEKPFYLLRFNGKYDIIYHSSVSD